MRRRPPAAPPGPPRDLVILSIDWPRAPRPRSVHGIPVVLGSAGAAFGGHVAVSYGIFAGDKRLTQGDAPPQVVRLRRVEAARWAGSLVFVAPYAAGDYDARLIVGARGGSRPALDAGGRPVVARVRVGRETSGR